MSKAHRSQVWRNKTKQNLIEASGSSCARCGYNKSVNALCFHHLDPSKKDGEISKMLRNPRKISVIIEEAKKCVLLCANCHLELHEDLWKIKEIDIPVFNESLFDKPIKSGNQCKMCDKETFNKVYCSRQCMGKNFGSVMPKKKSKYKSDVLKLYDKGMNSNQIAKKLGCARSTSLAIIKKHSTHTRI